MEEMTPATVALARALVADFERNLAFLCDETAAAAGAPGAQFRWSLALGTLALDAFESVVALLEAGKTRAAYMLLRPLVEYHVRLRRYAKDAALAQADWEARADLGAVANLFEPDEWDDDAQAAIDAALLERESAHAGAFRAACEQLEELEKKENEYRWARSAWLVEGAFQRGERAVADDLVTIAEDGVPQIHRASRAASARTIFFEAVWYLLDVMDSFGLVRGWVYGAVKARQDAVKLYLAGKPKEASESSVAR